MYEEIKILNFPRYGKWQAWEFKMLGKCQKMSQRFAIMWKKSKVTTKKSLDITVREKWHLMHLGRNYLNGDRFHFRDHGRQDKFVVTFQDLEK